ncbi:transposase [Escherichia coli DEC8B]|nr:transposase [Escherichia coli DEC8B]
MIWQPEFTDKTLSRKPGAVQFGTRSEKLRREVELAEALLKQREQDSDRYSGREDDPQVPRQLRQSRHRRPLPAHLPREIHRLEPEESCCPECGGELDYLGEVSAEQLELVSSALKVIRTERVKKPVQNVTVLLKHRRRPAR